MALFAALCVASAAWIEGNSKNLHEFYCRVQVSSQSLNRDCCRGGRYQTTGAKFRRPRLEAAGHHQAETVEPPHHLRGDAHWPPRGGGGNAAIVEFLSNRAPHRTDCLY